MTHSPVSVRTFGLTDDKLIIHLIYRKVPILETHRNERNRKVFTFDQDVAKPYVDEWMSGRPIMVEEREFNAARELFNAWIHDD